MTTLPLAGYRVLELAHLIAGPVCGMYLADMGGRPREGRAPEGRWTRASRPRACGTRPTSRSRSACRRAVH